MELAAWLQLPPNVGMQRVAEPGKGESITVMLGLYEIETVPEEPNYYRCRVLSSGAPIVDVYIRGPEWLRNIWLYEHVRRYEGSLKAGD